MIDLSSVIKAEALQDAHQIIDLQRNLFGISRKNLDSVLEFILNTKLVNEPRKIIDNIICACQFRPKTHQLQAELTKLLLESASASNKLNDIKGVILSKFFPDGVKYYFFLSYLQKCYRIGIFTQEEIVDAIHKFNDTYIHDVMPLAYLFIYFAPLIQAVDPKYFYELHQSFEKKIATFGVFYEVKEFIPRIKELQANNWSLFWREAEVGYQLDSIMAVIKMDNDDQLQKMSAEIDFDVNQTIKFHNYENIVFPDDNPTLIQFAAYYGSVKCFKFLKVNGADLTLTTKNGFTYAQFGVAGGDNEIIRILETSQCSFDGTLRTATQFHYPDLFTFLYTNKEPDLGSDPAVEAIIQSAAKTNNLEAVLFCLENKVNVNYIDADDYTALHLAAKYGCDDVIRLLLAHKDIDINSGSNSRTPLDYAAANGYAESVRLLLSSPGINVNAKNPFDFTALQDAAKYGHMEVIKLLLKAPGVDVNSGSAEGVLSALHNAITGSYIDIINLLLSVPEIDVNVVDEDGNTPLHHAARMNNTAIINVLLPKYGATIPLNNMKQTPLHVAAECPTSDALSVLIQPLAKVVNNQDIEGDTCLHLAAKNGTGKSISLLTAADPNIENNLGDTPLHLAAKRCRQAPLKALLAFANIDINHRNKKGQTPLHLMMLGKPLDGFPVLISLEGLDFNPQDEDGATPLHMAAKSIHPDLVNKLLEHPQVDPNVEDINGQIPLHKACNNSAPDAVKFMLKRKGININKPDNQGQTPLHIAAKAKESAAAQALLAISGIELNCADNNGFTPLHIAAKAGTYNIIRCLLAKKGVDIHAKTKDGKEATDLLPKKDNMRNTKLFQNPPPQK